MGLTARPSKNVDLSKIDEIQDEFFGNETGRRPEAAQTVEAIGQKDPAAANDRPAGTNKNETKKKDGEPAKKQNAKAVQPEPTAESRSVVQARPEKGEENLKIADLLATAQVKGVRHTSRPYTIPRSLTIDLNRLKAKFRTRDLHYTQNELMDKMIREALENVDAGNYFELREKAYRFVKSPEQCSRRSVTLTEETVSEMAELKAGLAMANNRRISSDELFTSLLVIAFSSLYENNLL
jgi:hypothetical protein